MGELKKTGAMSEIVDVSIILHSMLFHADLTGCSYCTSHDHEFIQTVATRIIEIDTEIIYNNSNTYAYIEARKPVRSVLI